VNTHDSPSRGPRCQGDEGSVLLIAIGFVLLFGLLAGSLLDATTTGLKETGRIHVQRTNIYTAEAAAQSAARRIRNDFVSNITAAQAGTWDCSTIGPTTVDASTSGVNGAAAAVTCASGTTTTFDSGGRPPNAIMTIGGSVTIDKRGTARIGGSIVSGGTLQVSDRNNGFLAAIGSIRAVGACIGAPVSHISPSPQCKTGPATTDPAYPPPSLPVNPGVLPTCGAGAVVTFSPGVYVSATALTNMFSGKNGPCKGKSFVFSPGVYVFNFPKGTPQEWKISDQSASVVAGAPGPWTTKPPIPGGCLFDGGSGTSAGTTFVFQGGSRLNVDKGHFELCAPNPGGGGQRLGIVGDSSQSGKILTTGDKATVTIRGTVYAPKGDVQLNTGKAVLPVLARGVVARSVKVQADVFNVNVVQLPSDAAHAQTDALLQLTATVAGGDALDAQVLIHNDASLPAATATTITTTDWEVHS
jgi:hypothetical protein